MERVQLLLWWKRALRVLPFALSVDMLHNIYYVTNLYKTRCDEWQQEDFEKDRAAILVAFHQVITRCQRQDVDLWPKDVSTGFHPAVVPLACSAPSALNSESKTALAVLAQHGDSDAHTQVYDDVEQDVFGQLCYGKWLNHAPDSCQIPTEADEDNTSPATAAMQQPHAYIQSALSAKATMLFTWYKQFQEHGFGHGKNTELKEDLLAKPHSALDPAQRDAAAAAHPSAKDATCATLALHWREYEQQDSAQSMQQGTMNRAQQADLWPQYAQRQGYPWPCMQIARRSALRWHVKWHGFVWPQKKELLVNLDHHY